MPFRLSQSLISKAAVCLLWIAAVLCDTQAALVVFLDNTNDMTSGQVGSNDQTISDYAMGYAFSVGDLSSSGVSDGTEGKVTRFGAMFRATSASTSGRYILTLGLWNADSNGLPTTLKASNRWILATVDTDGDYYTGSFSDVIASSPEIESNSKYAVTLQVVSSPSGGSGLKWCATAANGDYPANGSSNGFITHETFIESSTNDTSGTWSQKSVIKELGVYLSNTGAAVPEPHEYALMAGLGLIGFGIWRRRMKGTTSASA